MNKGVTFGVYEIREYVVGLIQCNIYQLIYSLLFITTYSLLLSRTSPSDQD